MSSKKGLAAAVMVLAASFAIFLYPSLSNLYNRRHASEAIAVYRQSSDALEQSVKEQMLEEAEAWNQMLLEGGDGSDSEYDSLLDVTGSGIMAYVEIPSIGVSLPVYHGTDEGVLQVAAGHLRQSSLPTGGKGTHSVISGHCGLKRARLFTDLDHLEEGDRFDICVLGEKHVYEVDRISIVLPEDTAEIQIVPDEDYCTLLTCTPYGLNTHRLLVRGKRVQEPENPVSPPEKKKTPVMAYALLAASSMVLAALLQKLAVGNRYDQEDS